MKKIPDPKGMKRVKGPKLDKKELKTAISGAKSMGLKGLNVTMPHKSAVMNYLDEVDATAKNIGAVNTILSNNGRLIGYNTDGNGAIIALQENGICPEEKKTGGDTGF